MAQAEVLPRSPSIPGRAADPCIMVIFGAAGDLTRRKLIPALFELAACQSLARRFSIVGFARSEMSDAAFQDSVARAVRENGTCKVEDEDLRRFHGLRRQVLEPGLPRVRCETLCSGHPA